MYTYASHIWILAVSNCKVHVHVHVHCTCISTGIYGISYCIMREASTHKYVIVYSVAKCVTVYRFEGKDGIV